MQASATASRPRTQLSVDMLPWTEWASDNSMCASTRTARAEPKTLDAAAFCTPDSFVDVANQCLVWQCLPVGLHVELPALEAAVTDAPLPLPFFVDDEDMLQGLLNAESGGKWVCVFWGFFRALGEKSWVFAGLGFSGLDPQRVGFP